MPTPLSFKRNGDQDMDDDKEHPSIPDADIHGEYFGASIRKGPHLSY